jgi:hypothetical protein
MRGKNRSILLVFILSLLTAGLLLFSSALLCCAEAADSGTSGSSAEEMMAGLSDEQVRQLLIEELRKDVQVEEPAPQKMKGPALLFSRLLRTLSNEHDESEDEVRALFSSLPLLGPDLYRVFVKL